MSLKAIVNKKKTQNKSDQTALILRLYSILP